MWHDKHETIYLAVTITYEICITICDACLMQMSESYVSRIESMRKQLIEFNVVVQVGNICLLLSCNKSWMITNRTAFYANQFVSKVKGILYVNAYICYFVGNV